MTIITLSELLIFLQMEKKNSQFCWVFQNLLMLLTYFWRTFSFLSEQAYADGGYYEESYDEGFLEAATKSLEQTWSDMSTFFWKTVEEGTYDFIFFILILPEHDKLLAGISKPYGVWKSQKKSHATLRDMFTFWVDKSLLRMPKWSILASF